MPDLDKKRSNATFSVPMATSDKLFLVLVSLFTVVAVAATAYIFLIQKDYAFVLEAPCDPAEAACFYRDCSTGECPPNELEYYRIWSVSAADFESCSDNSCNKECLSGKVQCEEVICDPEADEDCTEVEDHKNAPETVYLKDNDDLPSNPETSTTTPSEEPAEIHYNATSTLETTI
jgi:hypothetical protein